MEQPYTPISCGAYDELLALASRGRECAIRYTDDEGRETSVHARVREVFSRAGAEFVQLDDGTTVRLDRLVEVDGRALR